MPASRVALLVIITRWCNDSAGSSRWTERGTATNWPSSLHVQTSEFILQNLFLPNIWCNRDKKKKSQMSVQPSFFQFSLNRGTFSNFFCFFHRFSNVAPFHLKTCTGRALWKLAGCRLCGRFHFTCEAERFISLIQHVSVRPCLALLPHSSNESHRLRHGSLPR